MVLSSARFFYWLRVELDFDEHAAFLVSLQARPLISCVFDGKLRVTYGIIIGYALERITTTYGGLKNLFHGRTLAFSAPAWINSAQTKLAENPIAPI